MAQDDDGSQNDRDDEHDHQGKHGKHNGHQTLHNHARVNLGNNDANLKLHGDHITVIGQDGSVTVTGTHTNHDTITLGDGTDRVQLSGNHDKVTLGNGDDQLVLQGNHNQAKLGNGNDQVRLDGPHDTLTIGTGTNTIDLSANSHDDIITVGAGHDTIQTSIGDSHNTFSLDASTSSLVLHGTDNLVFINGGTDTITDSSRPGGDHLGLNVGSLGGNIDITNFSAAHGVVDLAPDLGFAKAADAAGALTSDGHGGSMLTFVGGLGSIDFHGVPVGSFTHSDFHIT